MRMRWVRVPEINSTGVDEKNSHLVTTLIRIRTGEGGGESKMDKNRRMFLLKTQEVLKSEIIVWLRNLS